MPDPKKPTPSEIESQFQETLRTTATQIAGADAAAIVTPDWMSILTQLFTGLISSCLGGLTPAASGAPAPPAPTPLEVATNLKNATPFQQAILHIRARKLYVQKGMTKKHGNIAASTLLQVNAATPVENLAIVVQHVNDVEQSFPPVDMF